MELAFAGYRAFAAAPDDPLRQKWDGVRWKLAVKGFDRPPGELNLSVNRLIKYKAEPPGQDTWQTPAETLRLGHGDCEDFAILKYALLSQAGVPVRLVVGEIKKLGMGELNGNRPHAWCAAYFDNEWRALDQIFDHVIPASDYINWLPMVACHGDQVTRFGRQFTINEALDNGCSR